jgi:hypothetical protein
MVKGLGLLKNKLQIRHGHYLPFMMIRRISYKRDRFMTSKPPHHLGQLD